MPRVRWPDAATRTDARRRGRGVAACGRSGTCRSALRSSRPSTFTNSRPPSGVTAKYGVDPRASTLAGVICVDGEPDRRQSGGDRLGAGPAGGAPTITIAAAPANHPTSTAWTDPNDISDVSVRTSIERDDGDPADLPPPAAQPRRSGGQRSGERSEGDRRREPSRRERPEIGAGRGDDGSLVHVGEIVEQRRRATAAITRAEHHRRPDAAHRSRTAVQSNPPTSTTNVSRRVAGDHRREQPVGDRVDAGEEVRSEHDDGVAEQPRHDEDDDDRDGGDDQSEEVGRRPDPAGPVVRCLVQVCLVGMEGRQRTSTGSLHPPLLSPGDLAPARHSTFASGFPTPSRQKS